MLAICFPVSASTTIIIYIPSTQLALSSEIPGSCERLATGCWKVKNMDVKLRLFGYTRPSCKVLSLPKRCSRESIPYKLAMDRGRTRSKSLVIPIFAMLGALAWQITETLIKVVFFVFAGEIARDNYYFLKSRVLLRCAFYCVPCVYSIRYPVSASTPIFIYIPSKQLTISTEMRALCSKDKWMNVKGEMGDSHSGAHYYGSRTVKSLYKFFIR
ncbi:hypothetical protein J5N97_010158 [Dioscorea zingiberensis]|uniref:Uncharacterized protein n=1 Tax=Dioscorea zingiberensis TaxID=325984 RepID=A0A9D5HMF9_9LILI|nr:hypothetical protein J5N97_010158 [Dioscorea zingiberensis]